MEMWAGLKVSIRHPETGYSKGLLPEKASNRVLSPEPRELKPWRRVPSWSCGYGRCGPCQCSKGTEGGTGKESSQLHPPIFAQVPQLSKLIRSLRQRSSSRRYKRKPVVDISGKI